MNKHDITKRHFQEAGLHFAKVMIFKINIKSKT